MGVETVAAVAAIVGAGAEVTSTVKEGHARKKATKASKIAADDKILDDKTSKLAEQESIATGQAQAVDAGNALKALGGTSTGAGDTIGAGNVQKRSVIGG